MSVGFIGRSEILYNTILFFLKKKIKIDFVYTSKAEKYYSKSEKDFKMLCKKNKITFFCDNKINSNLKVLEKYKKSFVISYNCQIKISEKILKLFKNGIFNGHMGDLPRYRGNATPNWAILKNEKKIAFCVHKMETGIDEGSIFKKIFFFLKKDTYISDIYKWVQNNAPVEFFLCYKYFKRNKLNLKKQVGRVLRVFPRKQEDSRVVWNDTSENIYKLIRASSSPFDGAFCYFKRKKLFLLKAKIYKPNFDFYAVPGQVCYANEGNPVVATINGLIEILKFSNSEKKNNRIKKLVLKSLRNRLL